MNITIVSIASVYLAFAVKHLCCDYAFQLGWMVRGKGASAGWLRPLAAHAAVHAAGTLAVVLIFAPTLWWLAPLDFVLHGTIDRIKGVVTKGWTGGEQRFWTAFGVDQMAHQLTHFAYVLAILARMTPS